jgi:nicotinate-nucleotide adenylyltransferase
MKHFETSAMNPKETIVYGGAFNPPTLAHQAILQACINHARTTGADVWLQPSGNRSDKTIDVPTSERMRMLHALTRDVIRRSVVVGIEKSELMREAPVETYDTVVEMNERYPDRRFHYVFGMDSVATMRDWKEGEWLIDNLDMLVVNRPGTLPIELGERATILEVETPNTSSTEVRTRLAVSQPIDDLVSRAVYDVLMTY